MYIWVCMYTNIYICFLHEKKCALSGRDIILPLRMHALAAKNDPVPCTCTSQNACFSLFHLAFYCSQMIFKNSLKPEAMSSLPL